MRAGLVHTMEPSGLVLVPANGLSELESLFERFCALLENTSPESTNDDITVYEEMKDVVQHLSKSKRPYNAVIASQLSSQASTSGQAQQVPVSTSAQHTSTLPQQLQANGTIGPGPHHMYSTRPVQGMHLVTGPDDSQPTAQHTYLSAHMATSQGLHMVQDSPRPVMVPVAVSTASVSSMQYPVQQPAGFLATAQNTFVPGAGMYMLPVRQPMLYSAPMALIPPGHADADATFTLSQQQAEHHQSPLLAGLPMLSASPSAWAGTFQPSQSASATATPLPAHTHSHPSGSSTQHAQGRSQGAQLQALAQPFIAAGQEPGPQSRPILQAAATATAAVKLEGGSGLQHEEEDEAGNDGQDEASMSGGWCWESDALDDLQEALWLYVMQDNISQRCIKAIEALVDDWVTSLARAMKKQYEQREDYTGWHAVLEAAALAGFHVVQAASQQGMVSYTPQYLFKELTRAKNALIGIRSALQAGGMPADVVSTLGTSFYERCIAYVHSDDGFWRWLLKHIEFTALDEQLFDLILHETGQAEWLRGEVLDAYLMQFIEAYKLADMSEVYQEYA